MATFETLYGEDLNLEINDSDSAVLYTTLRRQGAINKGQNEFADLTECLTQQVDIPCSCRVTDYKLLASTTFGSTSFSRLSKQGAEYIVTSSNGRIIQHLSGDQFPQRPIQFRNTYEPGWRQSTVAVKTPTGYSIRNDGGNVYLTLNEPPNIGSSETAVVRAGCVIKPTAMTSSGDIPFTVGGVARTDLSIYHQALPHYAAFKLLPLIGDREGSAAQLQLFQSYVARYEGKDRPKGGQVVTMARSYLRESRHIGRHDADASLDRDPRWRWR